MQIDLDYTYKRDLYLVIKNNNIVITKILLDTSNHILYEIYFPDNTSNNITYYLEDIV